jgi:hypothetical protein
VEILAALDDFAERAGKRRTSYGSAAPLRDTGRQQ